MPDLLERIKAALLDRCAVQREIGHGSHVDRESGRTFRAPPQEVTVA